MPTGRRVVHTVCCGTVCCSMARTGGRRRDIPIAMAGSAWPAADVICVAHAHRPLR